MVLFSLEDYFELIPNTVCEDIGITSIKSVNNRLGLDIMFVFFISIALSSHNILIKKYITLPDKYVPPWILLDTWIVSTTLSLLTIGIFARQQISFLFKFIHVACELLHLAYCLLIWNFQTIPNFIFILSSIALGASINMPCQVSAEFTELGAVLDTANFIVILAIAEYNPVNFRIMMSFFLHGTYIWTFLLMEYAFQDTLTIIVMRFYGFCANCLSVLVMALASTYVSNNSQIFYEFYVRNTLFLLDEHDTLYAYKTFKSYVFVYLTNLLEGFSKYTNGGLYIGLTKLKNVEMKETNKRGTQLTVLSNVTITLLLASTYCLFSIYLSLHWALCIFYTVLFPIVGIYIARGIFYYIL